MQKDQQHKQSKLTTIAVDLMGGDDYPDTRLETLLAILKSQDLIAFRVFVSKSYLNTINHKTAVLDKSRIEFIACNRSVSMSESPFSALRQKRESSLSLAIKDVADKQADICVTAGNTGAMVALSKYWFEPLCDIERPVLATLLPSKSKRALLLDIGATINASADDLYNFARIGSAWQQAVSNIDKPEVALLNIGTEKNKGDDAVKQADTLLHDSELNYVGFCEGIHLFNGFADVICCNGFVGNITLKACEAMAAFIKNESDDPAKASIWQKIKQGMRIIEPDKYNGALLLGFSGLVIKSHGACNSLAFDSALLQAFKMAQQPIVTKMTKILEKS
ncbi:MAG: phosphate acyltransferase PlsX [Proteobacteria bacterium]|nr:phosphate acyltransferase PlsX [Pseudomonadota bacterium]